MEMITNKKVFRSIEKKARQLSLVPDQLKTEQLQNVFLFKEYKEEYICVYSRDNQIYFVSETFGKGKMTNQVEFFKVFGAVWNVYPYKMIVFNAIAWYKRWLKSNFKDMDELYDRKRSLQKQHEWLMEIMEIQRASEKLLFINEVNNVLNRVKEQILSIGKQVIDIIQFWDFSIDEVCVLLGGNAIEGQRLYKEYQEDKKHQETFKTFMEYALHRGLEYRHRKGRMKDIYDCPSYEMPFYWAVNKVILDFIDNSPKAKEKINNFLKNDLGLTMYRTVEDLEGNILGVIEDGESD
ncbi:hypothetical protein BVH75_23100 [Bacillus thuringiensis]|nr:hypothetical protein BVH75_23100 [Bacillus thuringiensis]QDP43458.1 hypothetical protein [Bacillus phage vB_BthS-HD29phi]